MRIKQAVGARVHKDKPVTFLLWGRKAGGPMRKMPMTMARRLGWFGCLLLTQIGCLLFGTVPGQGATVDAYVSKYRTVELSRSQTDNVEAFEYLIRYFSSISYCKPRYKVNPDFIRALMLAESGGDPFAVSEKEAIGLCQLLYPTAKIAAKELLAKGIQFRYVTSSRLRNLQPVDLFDPAVNILLTSYLISKYNLAYDGRLDLVVAAWNAGQGAILAGQPPQYPETLDLIGKVNGYLLALLKQKNWRPRG